MKYNFKGMFDPAATYDKYDAVEFDGKVWWCKRPVKGKSPADKAKSAIWNTVSEPLATALKSSGTPGAGASFAQTYTEMVPGYVDCRDGSLKTGGNWQRTDYIPVNSNDLVTFSGRIGDYSGVAGYDENKNFVVSILDQIDEGKTGETYLNEPLYIRENVAYIVGCTNSPANAITVMVYDNMKPLADAILTLVDSRPV